MEALRQRGRRPCPPRSPRRRVPTRVPGTFCLLLRTRCAHPCTPSAFTSKCSRRLAGGERESAQKIQIERAKRVLEGYVRRTSMLLDAARLTGGAFTLTTEPVALDEVVGAISELYAAKADSQQTHIESRVKPR